MALILSCPSCGVKDRLPRARLVDRGRCGSCQAELPPIAAPLDVDATLLGETVSSAAVPVRVDFWAEWCGPCKAAAPHVARSAERMAGRAIVVKVDADRYPDLVERFQVPGFPTFLVLKGGREVRRHPGHATAAQMTSWREEVL